MGAAGSPKYYGKVARAAGLHFTIVCNSKEIMHCSAAPEPLPDASGAVTASPSPPCPPHVKQGTLCCNVAELNSAPKPSKY